MGRWPMPKPVQENAIVREKIWKNVHRKNKNFVGAFTGETGDGKSWGALALAQLLDPNFSMDQVAFTPKEFMDLVRSDEYGEGSVIIFDEAGVGVDNRNFYSEVNKQVIYALQTWRTQNRIALFTLPSLGGLDNKVKGRLHGYFSMKGVNQKEGFSLAKYYDIRELDWSGDMIRSFPELRDKGDDWVFKWAKFATPTKELREEYEEAQEEFKQKVAEDGYQTVKEEEEGPEEERTASDIANEIVADEELFEEFKKDNYGQKYLKKTLIGEEFDLSGRKAKRVKDLVYDKKGLDDRDNWI